MELIKQSAVIEYGPPPEEAAQIIERIGRTCYKSEDKIDQNSAAGFIGRIIKSGHESVIEHLSVTVRFISNRGVTHEMVRHRLAAYSQESTRYVNYADKPMQFILPVWMDDSWLGIHTTANRMRDYMDAPEGVFIVSCMRDEEDYNRLIDMGWKPQQAREVLGNALKTEVCSTYNMRTWRHVLRLRTSKAAHPQIRKLMQMAGDQLLAAYPAFFGDLPPYCFWGAI